MASNYEMMFIIFSSNYSKASPLTLSSLVITRVLRTMGDGRLKM